jgi:class 3 adenylate cyclase
MRPELPTGTVTFLFTDIEASTRLLHSLGPEAYADALAEHRRLLRDAFVVHGGVEVDTQGDAPLRTTDDSSFAVALADGRASSIDDAVALALGPPRASRSPRDSAPSA